MNMSTSHKVFINYIYVLLVILQSEAILKAYCATYKFSSEREVVQLLTTEYEKNLTRECNRLNIASFNYNRNLTDENDNILTKITLEGAAITEYYYRKYFKGLDDNAFSTEWLRRHMKSLTKIGDASLPKNEFEKVLFVILQSEAILKAYCATYKFSSEREVVQLLTTEYERNLTRECNRLNIASFNYNRNLTDENDNILTKITLEGAAITEYYYRKYFKGLDDNAFSTEWLRRHMKSLTKIGDASLPKNEFEKEPEVEDILAKSKNVDELAFVWQSWRDATGRKVKQQYREYVKLKNRAAVLDGFTDAGASWRYDYDMPDMEAHVHKLWLEVKPLYTELHTYILNKLANFYGPRIDVRDGLMPAHITGNNYAQSWVYLMPIVTPFPRAQIVDVTKALVAKNYTVMDLFETANEFYTSMGMADMRMSFGPKAMLIRPNNVEVVCHASAWDFCDTNDFRISMCADINKESFSVIHHELGHIQYFIQYRNQPYTFRTSANPGFHEAIGDAIVLSVMNPNHLKRIGLINPSYVPSYESTINTLMEAALGEIPSFAFTYLIDRWRWDVFKGLRRPEEWNELWWFYRRTIQGVKPPIPRTPLDFDPGSKYHVVGDTDYIAYFLANIIKFQLYRGLCVAAGRFDPKYPEKKPLHECDFYQSKAAGQRLKAGLEVGSSVHWSAALRLMTGQSDLDTSAVFDYFGPLIEFLKEENRKNRRPGSP